MNDSASISGIEQRKRRTRRTLTKHARRLTIDHGLHGFTVEQVCELAGVSRRTFFNYFASKEEAIVGPPDGSHHEAFDAFRAARPAGATGLSLSLVDDLVTLAVELIGEFDDVDEFDDPRLVIAREPQLLSAFIGAGETADREFAELVAEREGLPADEPAVTLTVALFTALVRSTADRFFTPGNDRTLAELLDEAVASARHLFRSDLESPRP